MAEEFIESPDTIHGRLLESVHITGYTMERACVALEWLLIDDRWKTIGTGFEAGDEFMATIDVAQFKIAADKRKRLVKLVAAMETKKPATQRTIATALGVDHATINRDMRDGADAPKHQKTSADIPDIGAGAPAPPPSLSVAGEDVAKKAEEKAHVANNSGENEWYTPSNIIEAARAVMGTIDLDPASCEAANATVKAAEYFDSDTDGTAKEWHGNVWLNPPYAQPIISDFASRLVGESQAGRIRKACVLVNNATETKWMQPMLAECSAVCFLSGRVKFLGRDGSAIGAPLQGQAVLYFGKSADQFKSVFDSFGVVFLHG